MSRLPSLSRAEVPYAPPAGATVLSAEHAGVRVDGRWLVRDVSLDLVAGRLLVVIGPNGAGKSTLLSLLAGDLAPTEGTVRIGGHPVTGMHPRAVARRRAVLPQRTAIAFPFTVGEVVAMGRAPWAGTSREDDDDVAMAAALRDADIEALAPRRFPTLSGGEQAQTSFARALAQRAGVLLLDEPTAALDLRHQEQIMRVASVAAAAGHAVLAVVHDIDLAAAYADDVAVLSGGRLVACGRPAEVLTEELLSQVYGIAVAVEHHADYGLLVIPRRRHKGGSQ